VSEHKTTTATICGGRGKKKNPSEIISSIQGGVTKGQRYSQLPWASANGSWVDCYC